MSDQKLSVQSVVFTGDISFDCAFGGAWKDGGCLDSTIEDYLRSADAVVGNVECPLTKGSIETSTTLSHACDPQCADYLKELNIGIWNLANNHIMDCGKTGLLDTIQCAEDHAVSVIGAGKDLTTALTPVIIGDEVKIGILGIAKPWKRVIADENTPGALTWNRTDEIKRAISNLKKQVRWVVVVAHGGREYSDIPYPATRKQLHRFLEYGADIVVAHHPHVIQNYETVGEKVIFYSLGNFIFDTENQRKYLFTDQGVLLQIRFTQDSFSFDHLPVQINRERQTVVFGETPAIFCDIDAKNYELLWPLEARYHYPIDAVNKIRIGRRFKNKPVTQTVLVHAVRFWTWLPRHSMIWNAVGKWNKSAHKDVCAYMKESAASIKKA